MITERLIETVVGQFQLDILGKHGLGHWARVFENGTRLAREVGANENVIQLFALFHDSGRVHELADEGHGVRGSHLANELFFEFDMGISRDELIVLAEACATHTSQAFHKWPTIQCCYDADRLDLARVRVLPDRKRLGSDAARLMVQTCCRKAICEHVPVNILGDAYRKLKQEA